MAVWQKMEEAEASGFSDDDGNRCFLHNVRADSSCYSLDSQMAETEPGVEAEVSEAETLGEVQNADLLLQGHPPEEAGTATLVAESEEGASEQTNAEVPVSEAETEKADTVSETKAAEAAGDTETETVKDYAASPLIYHCDSFDIELSFDSEEWKIPEGTVLIIKELRKEADQDSEEYRNYHYYDKRAKEELSAQDEKLAARAYALHYYEIQLKAGGKELPIPKGETDITIKYHFDDKSNNNEKEFRDEDSILASLFWHDKDETLLFDQNWDESDVITLKNNHLSKVYIKDLELADFENVIGLYACPPEKEVALKAEGSDYSVTAVCGKESGVPENAQLTVSEIRPDSEAYDQYLETAREAIGEETKSTLSTDFARFFDIKIMDNGEELTPDEEIEVRISFREPVDMEQMQTVNAVNFGEERAQVLDVTTEQNKNGIENVSFNAGSSSVTGIVGKTIEKTVLASDGNNYRVTVSYGPETGIPADADLVAEEITEESPEYEEYVSKTENALGWESGAASYARAFDIKIVDKNNPDIKYQPAEGQSVDVIIELVDSESHSLSVVHFTDGDKNGNVVKVSASKDGAVDFAADGFSIYVVADTENYTRLIYRFHDASDAIISTQYVKKYIDPETNETVYEELYDPGLVPEYGQRLVGWAYSADETNSSKIYQLADLDNHTVQKMSASDFEDGTIVNVYAIMDEAWYLRYMDVDEKGVVKILKTVRVPKNAENKQVDINYVVALPEGTHYEGWYDPVESNTYSEHLYEGEHENFDTVELDKHLDLYLKVDNRVWLVFDANAGGAGSGASYTPPQMLYTNTTPPQVTAKPEDPKRKGDTFTGWNTSPDGSGEDWLKVESRTFDADGNLTDIQYSVNKFGDTLDNDVILYAQWEPDDNFYRIAYWRQKETDPVDAADSEKKYDANSKVYTLKISNSAGCELPSTGGTGTRQFTIIGAMMIGAALGAVLLRRRRQIT